MMKYTGKYYMVLSLFLRRHLIEQFKNFMTKPPVSKFMSAGDLNDPATLKKGYERMHAMQDWADAHPEYKDKTWDFNFDEAKHKDGIYYHFTRCPLNDFARENGFLVMLPVCCEIDYYTTAAKRGVLHRDYTLATGGPICDYWIVPDKIVNPK